MKHKVFHNPTTLWYSLLFSALELVILIIDPKTGNIIDASKKCVDFYGYDLDELCSMNITEINPLSMDQLQEEMSKVLTDKGETFFFQHKLKDGTIKNVKIKSKPIEYEGEIFLYNLIEDITNLIQEKQNEITVLDAKIAEKTYQIREELRFKQALFDSIPGMIYVYNEENQLVMWNKKHEEMTGYSKEELDHIHVLDFYDEKVSSKVLESIDEIYRTGYIEAEVDLITKSKKSIKVKLNGVKLDLNGQRYFMGVGMDMTRQHELESNIKNQKELLESLIKAIHDCFLSIDVEGNIIYINRTCETMMECKSEAVLGKSLFDIISLKSGKRNLKTILQTVRDQKSSVSLEHDTYIINPFGIKIPISGSISPFFGPSNQIDGYAIIIRDISHLVKREEEIIYQSLHDQLTGAKNFRAFDQEMPLYIQEDVFPLTLMMLDINGLKLINDSFGHQMGDALIVKVVNQISEISKLDTRIYRYGGDEFVLVYPHMDYYEALAMLTKLKEGCAKEKIGPIEISVSVGFEIMYSASDSIQETLTEAENHMYRHKISENMSQKSKTIDVIMNALYENNNREMYHSKRVSYLAEKFTTYLDWPEYKIQEIKLAGMLHDIGKIGISSEILNKSGKLDDNEWKEITKHPEIGYRILTAASEFSEISRYVLEHHEKWDGSGYPRKISKNQISKEARVIAICDAYDAMTSKRTYRDALTQVMAIEELRNHKDKQFDPELVEPFINMVLQHNL